MQKHNFNMVISCNKRITTKHESINSLTFKFKQSQWFAQSKQIWHLQKWTCC